jgi:hypothetical protein
MSDETYYTVLNVKEKATPSEIKTAYRDLIKQVHPDTITNLAPFLRRIAEDKAKEITEAYTVLSNSSKRSEYDSQLAGYRRQTSPQAPPPTTPPPAQQAASQSSSGPYCNRCGTSLYASGFCPKCNKFTAPTATPAASPRPQAVRWLGYDWAPVMRWSREHPLIVIFTVLFSSVFIASLFSDANTSQPDSKPQPVTNNAAAASTGLYSKYPCDFRDKTSPIDGKPCSERKDQTIPAPPPGYTVDEKTTGTQSPTVSVSGTYAGTVHNQTANVSSTFTVVFHQTKAGLLDGCVEVKPPLQGSGVLRGSVHGSQVTFDVADITFHGDTSKSGIAGSYVVTRQAGNQLGDFHLSRQTGGSASFGCADGAVVEFEVVDAPPKPKPVVKSAAATSAVVTGRYGATIYKRCAFLPLENYGRCDYGPEEVAQLKQGDRVRVLSSLTRAQSGDDIYKVRSQQGWEGWARAEDLTLEPK